MQNASAAASYSFNNGLLLLGDGTDVTGEGNTFRMLLTNFQGYIIYRMTTSGNVADAAGKPLPAGQRTFTLNDDDGDGMAGDWEILYFGSTAAKSGAQDSDGDSILDGYEYYYARQNAGK